MSTTKTSRIIKAPPEAIYRALTDPKALSQWLAPGEMTGKIHDFDLRVGGGYEMSLFYPQSEKENRGKTSAREDRFFARFVEIVPNKKIVEAITFESDDPDFSGQMIMEITLRAVLNGSEITFYFQNIPPGIRPEDNEAGTISSLEKLARYVE